MRKNKQGRETRKKVVDRQQIESGQNEGRKGGGKKENRVENSQATKAWQREDEGGWKKPRKESDGSLAARQVEGKGINMLCTLLPT